MLYLDGYGALKLSETLCILLLDLNDSQLLRLYDSALLSGTCFPAHLLQGLSQSLVLLNHKVLLLFQLLTLLS